MASHYSSLVDFLDRGDPPQTLHEHVLITLNAPADFTDPRSGRTYRLFQSRMLGPWTPGDAEFDRVTGGRRDRDHLYQSVLSVNYDPGRPLKYAGSLLIVVGMVLVYGVRALRSPGYFVVAIVFFSGTARAGDSDIARLVRMAADARAGRGGAAPLDTVARQSVEAICGRSEPTLAAGNGPPRKFTAAELLFSWLAEPEQWENVPFLPAEDVELRQDVLGLPLEDSSRPAAAMRLSGRHRES